MSGTLAITETVLVLPDGPRQATLRIRNGRIVSIGAKPASRDVVIPLPDHTIYPGLINAHDHLELNGLPPTKWRDVYANANEWGRDALAHLSAPEIANQMAIPLRHRLFFGGLKNLLAGVTTVMHHNPLFRRLRTPDFPVRVVRHYGWAHSLAFGDDVADSFKRTSRQHPWIIHLAEGSDEVAAGELQALDRIGCLASNTLLVHGVGLSADDRQRAIEAGAGLIWCPASNLFLLGKTGQISDFAQAKRLAIGNDSRLTGTRDLLEEMKVAAQQSKLDARKLFDAVTVDAARLLRLENVGRLAIGAAANLIALRSSNQANPYKALLEASREDLQLVMIGGKPKLSSMQFEPLWQALHVPYTSIELDGKPKLIARRLFRRARRLPMAEKGLDLHPL